MILTGIVATALIPTVLVQAQAPAAATQYFCVAGNADAGNGQTMAGKGYPSPVDTEFSSRWGTGSGGNTIVVKGLQTGKTHRYYHPDFTNKRECMATAAAPCVVTDTVTITEESWTIHNWELKTSGAVPLIGVGLAAGYGGELGKKKISSYTLSNMVPYKTGTTVAPAGFTDYRKLEGTLRGAFFKVGDTCRAGGDWGVQYVFRDEEWAPWTAEEYVGSGSAWVTEGDPLEKWL